MVPWRTAARTHWAATVSRSSRTPRCWPGTIVPYPDNLPITNATGGPAASQAAARFAGHSKNFLGEVPRDRHGLRYPDSTSGPTRHRLPSFVNAPGHQRCRRMPLDPLPGRPGTRTHRRIRADRLRRTGIRTGRHTAVPAAAGGQREVEDPSRGDPGGAVHRDVPRLHVHPRHGVRPVPIRLPCASYSAVFSNVSGLKGGNFVRIAGVEVGKVKGPDAAQDGTVTVDFAIDRACSSPRAPGRRCATRTSSVTATCRWRRCPVRKLLPGQTIPTGPHRARTRRRRADRRLPAVVPGARPRSGERPVGAAAAGSSRARAERSPRCLRRHRR